MGNRLDLLKVPFIGRDAGAAPGGTAGSAVTAVAGPTRRGAGRRLQFLVALLVVLLAANAAGAVVGGILLEGRGLLKANARNASICSILWCVAIIGFAASHNYHLSVVLLFCAGLLNLAFLSMAQTLVQLQAPSQLRGRLIGLFNTSNNGLRAFSGVTVGVVGGLIGVHWSLALSAMILLGVTVTLFALVIPERFQEDAG